MNPDVEDQIRAAIRAKAETLREVRPLRLPPAPGAQPGLGSGFLPRRARRLRPWIAPVTAAVAVIALAISLVLVRDIPHGASPNRASPNERVFLPSRPATAASGVPRYYVATIIERVGSDVFDLIVNDTFTGARLATVKPPPGSSFGYVTAAADDRTFVVTAGHSMWLLRLAPGTSHPARLTRLRIPDLGIGTFWALSLSSSGRELAMGFSQTMSSPTQLRIYSVTTGKLERAWSTPDKTVFGSGRWEFWGAATTALTWVDDDRALALSTQSISNDRSKEVTVDSLRLLDMSAGGSDLIADSRVIWSAVSVDNQAIGSSQPDCASVTGNPMLTAEGKTVVCGAATNTPPTYKGRLPGPVRWTLAWLAYSMSAPTAARTAARLSVNGSLSNPAWVDLVWTNSSGSTLIGVWGGGSYPGPPPPADRSHWGVITDGQFLPLPTVPDMAYLASIAW